MSRTFFLRASSTEPVTRQEGTCILGPLGSSKETISHALNRLFKRPRQPSAEAMTFLYGAIGVFCADLLALRDASPDRWTRDLEISIPSTSSSADLVQAGNWLSDACAFMSADRWRIDFRRTRGLDLEPENFIEDDFQPDAVCLFSGGVDSFVGAAQELRAGAKLLLVGHWTTTFVSSRQMFLAQSLQDIFGKTAVQFVNFPIKPASEKFESTQRTRSLLFLALAVTVASSFGKDLTILIPENGFIGINPPMIPGRLGASSTRTTHPTFLKKLENALEALGLRNRIHNPLESLSKGEVIGLIKGDKTLSGLLKETVSCSHPTTVRFKPHGNCGYCLPCIVRRAAFRSQRMGDCEYLYDAIGNPHFLESEEPGTVGADLRAVARGVYDWQTGLGKSSLRVLTSGRLDDPGAFYNAYAKGMKELYGLLKSQGCDELRLYAGIGKQ